MSNDDPIARSGGTCELCGNSASVSVYAVPCSDGYPNSDIAACSTCVGQMETIGTEDQTHWQCLNDAMWSPVPAVQVTAWRMLKRLSGEVWANDLLDMLYLDEHMMAWAEAGATSLDQAVEPTLDVNGARLSAGDNVVLIKDLDVKGTSFVAKRGTAVRNIALTNNPEHIEGRVNGTRIVIISQYVKKS